MSGYGLLLAQILSSQTIWKKLPRAIRFNDLTNSMWYGTPDEPLGAFSNRSLGQDPVMADSKRRQIFWKKEPKEIAYLTPNRASPGWADRLPR